MGLIEEFAADPSVKVVRRQFEPKIAELCGENFADEHFDVLLSVRKQPRDFVAEKAATAQLQ